jgi:enamine deaminase RidA (YjgF/YER057c/UK114 family)
MVNALGRYAVATVLGDFILSSGITPRTEDNRPVAVGPIDDMVSDAELVTKLARVSAARAVAACRSVVPAGGVISAATSLWVYLHARQPFTGHSMVADFVTDAVLDEIGGPPPARMAVGVSSLPSGAPMEIQLLCHWTTTTGHE